MSTLIETIKTPLDSVNDTTVIITQILVENGQPVQKDDLLAEIETSKALVEINATDSGFIKILSKVGQEVAIGSNLFEIYSDNSFLNDNEEEQPAKFNSIIDSEIDELKETQISKKEYDTQFTEKAIQLLQEKGIDKQVFNRKQFVTVFDVWNFENRNASNSNVPLKNQTIIDEKPSNGTILSKQKTNEMEYLSGVNASGMISRLCISVYASMSSIIKNQNFITSTPLPIIAHEVSRLLNKYPNLNSYFKNGYKVDQKDIHLGIALDNGRLGLKVASLLDCNLKSLVEIEESISELSLKYNDNKLTLEELNSSTFTITDLFSTGITNFHPLVNFNNAAILGICGLHDGRFNIEMSFDHRLTNGLEGSKFLNDLKFRIETRLGTANSGGGIEDVGHCYRCLREIEEDMDGNLYFLNVENSKFKGKICSNCFNGI